MDALKRKAKATLEDIQRAENKQKVLTQRLRLALERADLAECEVKNLKARIDGKKKELDKCCKKLRDKEHAYQVKEEMAEESEKERKDLESKEFDLNDNLVMLERKASDAKKRADEVEARQCEARVNYSCLKKELSENLARLNAAESKICKLKEEADTDNIRLINLENKHKRYGQREEYFEDKVEMMTQQMRNFIIEAGVHEAEAKELVGQRDKLKGQVNSWNKRVLSLKRELEDVKADLNQ